MRSTSVSRCLDKKLIMFGFEVFDLLSIFLLFSVLNLIFGQSSMKLVLVWLPPVIMAAALRYGKQGKPEKYLVHWIRFQIKPGTYSAFPDPTVMVAPPSTSKKETR